MQINQHCSLCVIVRVSLEVPKYHVSHTFEILSLLLIVHCEHFYSTFTFPKRA